LPLILASSSAIRRQMLDAAGVEYAAVAPGIDEAAVKAQLDNGGEIAAKLAEAKASNVSVRHHGAWVVGSDSVVTVGGQRFDKPRNRDEAADHLSFFSGKTMTLTSAVALARNGALDWSHVDEARLKVRPLTQAFIDAYLDAEWPDVSYCVGVFRLEGRGVQLFDGIDGNYFTILGMPLVPLLRALRERDLIAT
jgi:septum formation protein